MTGGVMFELGGVQVPAGTRRTIDLPVSSLSDHTPVSMAVHVVNGRRPGPVMFVSAAIHGDEVIGVEIVRRLLRAPNLDRMAGTLLAVPIVNTFGFLNHSRYLPDRRDLNRCFPGSAEGSLGARLAHIFLSQIVKRSDFGIDLHSAAVQRSNLPQIRLTPGNTRLEHLAQAFGAPVMLHSKLRDGSLRMAAETAGVDVLLYEAGEGLRFDELAARSGLSGILRVMQVLGMIGPKGVPRLRARPVTCTRSSWYRAPAGGLLRAYRGIGDLVEPGMMLGAVSDPFGVAEVEITAQSNGIIVGRSNMPVVNEGDALFHVAETPKVWHAEAAMEGVAAQMDAAPLFDEDEII
ncbi:MAG: succinylglutamate desuccinylase/aspartoacylase family protein [Paracoccaceae bacterium]|jgi:predicted deacylase|uniref:succinylglutamate desuccinylase/aspartoacylase family protein n=1 Tax=unclassified Seohaeicola TaxID=2641111 RepID=UPI00237C0C16|nr:MULTISPECIES: succinylglutamate desuccinylase/aspartoacylase family protein [unclassified Seohaeicola]MDD9706567.1 succinylglutamate desuccinylase/aspartoacylase family protein [Seohaeicola sp. 4SK31]MDD9734273.1 succinylglutamate desuccinylase/aspartoacylase family protein [Seohaeicola sp. SP36]MDF1706641.1 succinylglutamate desuccinylase/aspartoacylase family protein [Paracoccaceae bacterium]MDM7968381.1 succinylglutamate desuccinylase/aspartoacylase family protein [Paracoccaceae bacterium